jgi:hypothetical protein
MIRSTDYTHRRNGHSAEECWALIADARSICPERLNAMFDRRRFELKTTRIPFRIASQDASRLAGPSVFAKDIHFSL